MAVAHEQIDYEARIHQCEGEIARYEQNILGLRENLKEVETELEQFSDERQKYELLTGICERIEALDECGGQEMFWGDLVSTDRASAHMSHIREQADFFQKRITKITDRRDTLNKELKEAQVQIEYLSDEIVQLKEDQERAKYDYMVSREIRQIPYRMMIMPWTKQGGDEREFRKIFLIVMLLTVLLGWLVPMYDVPPPDPREQVEIPERLAKFIKKKEPPKPKPKPKQEVKDEKPKDQKEKPTEKQREQAREKVKNKGVLEFKQSFNALLDTDFDQKLSESSLSTAGSNARQSTRKLVTSGATQGSGGIASANISRDVAGSGSNMEGVAFSRVETSIGEGAAEQRKLSKGPGPSRTDEEIQIVFDRYKAALYRIYNRELRKNPTLQGKMVLRITIMPDGSVALAKVETTDLDSATLSSKIVARVKRFNFGAKEGVPKVTILYPIDFLPAS